MKDLDPREMEKEVILADKGMLTDCHMHMLLFYLFEFYAQSRENQIAKHG